MMRRTPILTKSFHVLAAVEGYLILAASADGQTLEVATASTAPLMGASGEMGAPAGGLVDVDLVGVGEVRIGGNVEHGEPLTSNALGRAVKAVPVAGQVVRIIGFAIGDSAAGDLSAYLIAPGVLSA